MNTITSLIVALLIAASPFLGETAPSESSTIQALNQRVSLNTVELWPLDKLLAFAFQRGSIPYNLSPKLNADRVLRCKFKDTELRYIVAWGAKFMNAHVSIEDGIVVFRPAAELPANHPLFDCVNETDGNWAEGIRKGLMVPMTMTSGEQFDFDQASEFIAYKAGVPLILDPELFDAPKRPKFTMKVDAVPCGEVLQKGLDQVGMQAHIQGGVLFITNKKNGNVPNNPMHLTASRGMDAAAE